MCVTYARDHTSYPYKLSGCTLQSVTETVDLGVSLTSNLSWNTQTQKVVNKAKKIVGFLKRNVGPGTRKSFLVCTRPWLYPFWNMLSLSGHPIYRRTLTLLNESNVGPRNTLSRCHLGTLRTKLGWSSLPSRRSYLSLLECYKTIHGLNGLNYNDYFEFNCYAKTRSNHSIKLRQPLSRVNCFLHSFFVRIIKQWNALPKEIVHEQDFSICRSKLRKYCEMFKYFFFSHF